MEVPKYNKLTRQLLAAGYTKDQHPDYVKHNGYSSQFELLGGFIYQPWFIRKLVFQTGCGLLVAGEEFADDGGGMGYQGITWCAENNNPIIMCPYVKCSCEYKNPLLNMKEGSFFFAIATSQEPVMTMTIALNG
ncbi:hypothetical protein QMP26_41285 (plasmid) [Enterocloster clostridioformis]